jgi:endoglucanase
MYNTWGGPLDVAAMDSGAEDNQSRNLDFDRASVRSLEETQQSWLLEPARHKAKPQVDLGCMTCSRKFFFIFLCVLFGASATVGLAILIWKVAPRKHHSPQPLDNYTIALQKSLLFFDAQKSGVLPSSNNIPWRGTSAVRDGSDAIGAPPTSLSGGFYDAGDNIKFGFPGAYAMTLLSWSVIEYAEKYQAAGEYEHMKEIIKWGTDYMMKTFNISSTNIQTVFAQVGAGNESIANDHSCWERPEDMDYARPAYAVSSGPDLGGEMAAALAAASIVFRADLPAYSSKLLMAARNIFTFARDGGKRNRFVTQLPPGEQVFYNSTGFWDEYIWGGAWLYYATGNSSYLSLVTNPILAAHAGAKGGGPWYGIFSWDNKLAGAQLLLTRLHVLQSPGYPYEAQLQQYWNETNTVMCSYLPNFKRFNRTKGGLVELNHGGGQPLQYVASAAFLSALYADYLRVASVPSYNCGPYTFPVETLRNFSRTQLDYILGKNPLNMSYVVGYGDKYPKQVHHRAASIPKNGVRYGCQQGRQWLYKNAPNPHVIVGAMVGGPNARDEYRDYRDSYGQAEPTLAGNAALTAALIAVSTVTSTGIDANTIFGAIPLSGPTPPPPPAPYVP